MPLPTTKDESWRFTDLKGFDPETSRRTAPPRSWRRRRCSSSRRQGRPRLRGRPRDRPGARGDPLRAARGAPAPRRARRLRREVRRAQRGRVAARPARPRPQGVVLEQPLLVRITNSVDGGSLFWRLLIVAEPGSRVSVIEEYASTAPELSGYLNAAVEIFVEEGAKVEYVSVQNVSRETWHFGTHHALIGRDAELDWVAAASARRRARSGSRTTSPARAPPRASPAPTSPTASSTSTTTPSRSTSPRTRRPTSPSRASSTPRRPRSGAG